MSATSVCLLLLSLVSAATAGACHDGWVTFRESCYLLSREVDNWAEANFNCQIFHSELISITDEEENKFLKSELMRLHQNDPHKNNVCYLTSGTDTHVEGNWEWANIGQRFTFTDWFPGEPNNNYHGGLENCLCLYGNHNFQWNDEPCNLPNHFICRAEQSSETAQVIG